MSSRIDTSRKAEVRRTAITLHTTAAVTALAVLAPTLAPGYVLSYDMVFTPRLPLMADAMGLGTEAPRAVPQDALVALASLAVRGDLLQKVALVAAVYLAVLGAARLVPAERWLTPIVAGVAYGWNAYLAERLFLGHWSLLLAYAALPWIVRAALAARRDGPVAPIVGWSALAAITPTGGVLALVTTAVALAWPGRGSGARRWWAIPAVALLNAPWLVAGALASSAARSDPAGVDVFVARAENWSGPVGTLLGLGGVWNRQVVPASRESLLAPVLTLVVLAGAAWGFTLLRRTWATGDAAAVVALAGGGLALALLGVAPGGPAVLRWLVETVPGAGLFRDGHKFLAPFALLLAVAFALGAERLADAVAARSRVLPAVVLAAAALFPVISLPDLAWGGLGRLVPVQYPADWARVATHLARADGDLVTLPYTAFRAYGWNGRRTSLDPADRYLPVSVVVDDSLAVAGPDGRVTVVAGESRRADEVRRCVARGCPLPSIGVRWALVETDQPAAADETAGVLTAMRRVYTGETLVLYEASGAVPDHPRPPSWHLPVLVAAYIAAAGSLFVNGVASALRRRRTGW